MENKKTIAVYCCTNGLGHFKRVSEVAKYLSLKNKVTIYCSPKQLSKIGPVENVSYILTENNLRWDKVVKGDYETVKDEYFNWLEKYGPTTDKYDIVISDNIVGLLNYRSSTILMGSFLWKDVLQSKIGINEISALEEELLSKYKPILITNKYVETQSVTEYSNKLQTGFGEKRQPRIAQEIKYLYYQSPSSDYGLGYSKVVDKIARLELPYIKSGGNIPVFPEPTAIIARPGVGTITHCVINQIPLIALFSRHDSQEIIELAEIVEKLKIGFKQDIDSPIRLDKFKQFKDNTNYCYAENFEDEGYIKISKYIESI